jgi:hypothetical protein
MTIENWLMIAVIISTLIAPSLPNLIQSRTNQPKPTPETNHPKNRTQRIGGWLMRFFQSVWFIVGWHLVVIALNIYILHGKLRKTAPITRGDVFSISMSVASIWFVVLNMTVIMTQQSISFQADSISTLTGTVGRLLDMIKTLDETVDLKIKTLALPNHQRPTPVSLPLGTLRKMLNAINKVFRKSN